MSKITQCERIEKYMKDFGSISTKEAMNDLGVMRLASRISDMKKNGLRIIKETENGLNRYGEVTHYARYRMEEAE